MLRLLGLIVIAAPFLLTAVLGLCMLFRIQLSERVISRLTAIAVATGLAASLAILVTMLVTDSRYVPVSAGDWVRLPDGEASHAGETGTSPEHHSTPGLPAEAHFHFTLKFVFDRLSVPFVVMTFVLCGVISAFASRYLHREQGFPRFFLLFSFFLTGMILSSAAGTIETLFFGWELVGLSSALLVAFFQDRRGPVQNGLRVWSIYRVADAAFLLAALTLHHLSGSGDFAGLAGQGAWPAGDAVISPDSALLVGMLLLLAAAGKSALIPFSGWLPRAMEGPTPSSAIFYGALSVHLGAFLLLRMGPLLEESLLLQTLVILLGLSTCVFAAMAARVQADVKSSLAFASLIQVSLIVTEIGFGLRYIPLIHIIGHASFRTLQLVRAPSLLKDYNSMINALGDHHSISAEIGVAAPAREVRLYRFAFDRGNLDSILDECIVRPVTAAFLWSDRMERRWTAWLSGTGSTGQFRAGQPSCEDSAMSGQKPVPEADSTLRSV